MSSCTMTGSHITITLGDMGARHRALTVMSRYSRYILCVPDRELYLNHTPKFLIFIGFFAYFLYTNNFASCLLKLAELTKEIPKPGFCNNFVWCKDSHAIKGCFGLGLCW